MNKILSPVRALVLLAGIACAVWPSNVSAGSLFDSLKNGGVAKQLRRFVAEKKTQSEASTNEVAPGFAPFFEAAERGDWLALSNSFDSLKSQAGQYEHTPASRIDPRLHGTRWEAVKEVWGGFEAYANGDEKYSTAFGRGIIESIPLGSIYFGGTDPGRFIVTALCKSQKNADPFFVLTQNALADPTYRQYLQETYRDKIHVPTDEESTGCFSIYIQDAERRLKSHELKPGENVQIEDGRTSVSGQVAVMEINGLLAKVIFEKNPDKEFFVEESFPLDWMYPRLEPHGLIFKLNREELDILPEDVVQRDTEYWEKLLRPIVGHWLDKSTSVAEIATFADKTFNRRDFGGFEGDRSFVQNPYSHKMFSKLRSSIAGLYVWRMNHTGDVVEKKRMEIAADYAFRQSLAMCPYSPEAVYRYIGFLTALARIDDAILVAQTGVKTTPQGDSTSGQAKQLEQVVAQLKKNQAEK